MFFLRTFSFAGQSKCKTPCIFVGVKPAESVHGREQIRHRATIGKQPLRTTLASAVGINGGERWAHIFRLAWVFLLFCTRFCASRVRAWIARAHIFGYRRARAHTIQVSSEWIICALCARCAAARCANGIREQYMCTQICINTPYRAHARASRTRARWCHNNNGYYLYVGRGAGRGGRFDWLANAAAQRVRSLRIVSEEPHNYH